MRQRREINPITLIVQPIGLTGSSVDLPAEEDARTDHVCPLFKPSLEPSTGAQLAWRISDAPWVTQFLSQGQAKDLRSLLHTMLYPGNRQNDLMVGWVGCSCRQLRDNGLLHCDQEDRQQHRCRAANRLQDSQGKEPGVMTINVLLSGRLRLAGYGQGYPSNGDGTFLLDLPGKSTVEDVIRGMKVPTTEVTMTMLNGRKCGSAESVQPGDRVILIPSDVACLWRFLGSMNLGAESVFDF
jgi:hypothetical protein